MHSLCLARCSTECFDTLFAFSIGTTSPSLRINCLHALALWLKDCRNVQDYPADSQEMARYIHGDVVPSDKKGWCLVTANGYSIGWGKGDGRVLKNHYPKGLRR